MPFEIPSLQALVDATARAFRANLKGSDARLWPNNVAASAKVMAGALAPVYAYLDYISRQSVKHLAEGQWLERHAFDYGLARLPATYAEGKAVIAGDNGVTVPEGLVLQRADGIQYETTSSAVIAGGTATVTVRALEPGRAGNAVAEAALTLTESLDRISDDAEVAAGGISLGADTETDASLRARLLFRLRNPPHGGAAHDYVAWAREVNGVTRVFVDPVTATNARTSVGVWFLMDDLYPTNGIPQAADVTRVAAYIDARRPAGAIVQVGAPTARTINITISNLTPDTVAIRTAIEAELRDMIRRQRVATLTDPVTLHRSKIIEAISLATGEDHHTLTVPAADIVLNQGEVPVLGTVTYVV